MPGTLESLVAKPSRSRANRPRGTDRSPALPEESVESKIRRCLLEQTPSLTMLAEPLALAASYDVTVLLAGETGTGKTHLARWIHQFSSRRSHALHVVPCGALVPSLVESELFGHVRGAFTGADRAKVGRFEAAGEGTLLLDEIDALGLEQQACLLRVVETGEYEPVGSNQKRISRARIIAACHSNLVDKVEAGEFRRDLYYRLNVVGLHLPPLRERLQDIPPLTRHIVSHIAQRFRKSIVEIDPDVIAALQAFPWPGNIRQLENVLQQAVLHSTGPRLLNEHLPQPVRVTARKADEVEVVSRTGTTLFQNREIVEREVIRAALANNHFNRARAARALGVSRVTLYKKIKKYGLMQSAAGSNGIAAASLSSEPSAPKAAPDLDLNSSSPNQAAASA
jgi:transcriptional regulator with PAS, ATPase and Fis domain